MPRLRAVGSRKRGRDMLPHASIMRRATGSIGPGLDGQSPHDSWAAVRCRVPKGPVDAGSLGVSGREAGRSFGNRTLLPERYTVKLRGKASCYMRAFVAPG